MTEEDLKKIRQNAEVQELLKKAIKVNKVKDNSIHTESHSDNYKIDAKKLDNLARAIRLNKNNAKETTLLELIKNKRKYNNVTLNSIVENIYLNLGISKSTLFNRIDKLLRFALNISAFKNGKQECTYNDKNLFSEYFFTSYDADLIMQLSYVEKLNYDNTYKETLQIIFIAMSDLNNTEVITAAREVSIDNELQDFIEDVLIDCEQDPELSNKRKELSPLFFDDNEFLEIVGNIAGGYFYTISQDLTKEIKDCMDIMFFCDHNNIQIMYESLFNLINISKYYAQAAKDKIDNYIQRYEHEYEGYSSDEKQTFREEIKMLKCEINKSEIAKQVFKECGDNEKLKI